MGVDFFPCDNCGESICDCGDYKRCNDMCGRRWCDKKCASEDGYKPDNGDEDDMEGGTCKFCRNEDVEDGPLLHFLLTQHFNMPKDEAKKLYFEWLKQQPPDEE